MAGLIAHSDLTSLLVGVALLVFFSVGVVTFVWNAYHANQQRKKQQQCYLDNVERHRVHAERAEQHMAHVESLLERIAIALERKMPEEK